MVVLYDSIVKMRNDTFFLEICLYKKENVTFADFKVTFEPKKIQYFRGCQNDRSVVAHQGKLL